MIFNIFVAKQLCNDHLVWCSLVWSADQIGSLMSASVFHLFIQLFHSKFQPFIGIHLISFPYYQRGCHIWIKLSNRTTYFFIPHSCFLCFPVISFIAWNRRNVNVLFLMCLRHKMIVLPSQILLCAFAIEQNRTSFLFPEPFPILSFVLKWIPSFFPYNFHLMLLLTKSMPFPKFCSLKRKSSLIVNSL